MNNNNMKIVLQAKIDTSPTSVASVNAQIAALAAKLKPIELKVNASQLGKINTQITNTGSKASKVTKELTKNTTTFVDELGVAVSRTITWGVAMGTIYGNLRKLREGIDLIKQLDANLTQVQMVTGMTVIETRNLAQEYMNLAKEMKISVLEVTNSSVELFRQGLGKAEVEERLKVISKTAKATAVDVNTTSEYITAGVNSTKMAAEDYADLLIKAADISATSFQELGDGMSKVVSAANVSGIAVQKLTSWLATLSETTRLSASTLGQSTKTIIARFNRINEETGEINEDLNTVQTAVESVGIAFLDLDGQIRPVSDILDDLAIKWDGLDKNTQQYLSTQIAGVRQISNFQALMENYNRSLEINNELTYAGGTLNRQYAKYLNSVEASAMNAKTAFEQMWMNALNSDGIKAFYNVSASLTTIVDKVGLLNVAVTTLTSVLLLSQKGFRTWAATAGTSAVGVGGLTGMVKALSGALTVANVKIAAATFGLSLLAAFLVNKGVEAFNASSLRAQEQQAFEQSQKDAVDAFGRNQVALEKQLSTYRRLKDQTTLNVEESAALQKTQNEIGKMLPSLIAHTDEYGNSVLKSTEEIEAQVESLRNLRNAADAIAMSSFKDDMASQQKKIAEASRALEELQAKRFSVANVSGRYDVATKAWVYETNEEQVRKDLERHQYDLLVAEENLNLARQEANELLLEQVRRVARASGVTGELTNSEVQYLNVLIRRNNEDGTSKQTNEELIAGLVDLALRRDELNSAISDSTKHLSLEQVAIKEKIDQLKLEVDYTKKLTDAQKDLLRAQVIARYPSMSEMTMGAGVKLSQELHLLEEVFDRFNSLFGKGSSGGGGGTGGEPFGVFDLSLRKLELVNAEVERLQDSLELVTDQEQRQTIYDQMINTYKQKQTLLSQMLTWQKQELANAQTILRGSVSSSDYAKILSGDFSNLSVGNEAAAKAIENFQRLASEVLKTESAIREVEIAYTRLGQTAQSELQTIIDKQINLSFYLMEKEISRLNSIKNDLQRVAETRISVLEAEIQALEASDKLAEEREERQRRVNELTELYIQLNNTLKEKTTQQLQKQADGTFDFVYVADPEKVADLNKQIRQKQEDMAEWEEDLRHRKRIDALRDEIQGIRDKLAEDLKGYDKQIDNLQNFMTEYKTQQSEFYGQVVLGLEQFMIDLKDADMDGYGQRLFELAKFVSAYNTLIGQMKGGAGSGVIAVSASPSFSTSSSTSSSPMTLRDYAGSSNVGWDDKTGNVTINGKAYSPSQLQTAGLQLKDGRWQGTESQLRQALGFKYGGVADFTGPTSLHASPSSVETIFNATDGKKLFNFVHSLPQRLLNMPTPTAPLLSGKSGAGTIMNVYPQFPNVKDGNQIIKAIQGLPRLATQLAPNPV